MNPTDNFFGLVHRAVCIIIFSLHLSCLIKANLKCVRSVLAHLGPVHMNPGQ